MSLEANVSLVMSRVDPYTFLKTGMAIRSRRPDVGLYMLSRSSVDQAGSILRELKVRACPVQNQSQHQSLVPNLSPKPNPNAQERLESLHGMQYSGKGSPSSGFVGTWMLLQLCGRVDVYGVGLGGPAQGTVNDQDTFVPPAWRRQR